MIIKVLRAGDEGFNSFTPGKLADVELHFEASDGLLAGLRLIGFSVWERRGGGLNVTFPARSYAVNGERRSFALLRPSYSAPANLQASDRMRDAILDAYRELEAADRAGVAAVMPAPAVAPRVVASSVAPAPEGMSAILAAAARL